MRRVVLFVPRVVSDERYVVRGARRRKVGKPQRLDVWSIPLDE